MRDRLAFAAFLVAVLTLSVLVLASPKLPGQGHTVKVHTVAMSFTPRSGDPGCGTYYQSCATCVVVCKASFHSFVTGGDPPYVYLFDFGDGNTSSDPNPIEVYVYVGWYNVNLTVTDQMGLLGDPHGQITIPGYVNVISA